MTAVADMGRIIKETAELSDLGAAKLVVFANAVEDNPFMAGAFHGVGEADVVINVGVSGPGVVKRALEKFAVRVLTLLLKRLRKQPLRLHVLVNWLVKWRVNV